MKAMMAQGGRRFVRTMLAGAALWLLAMGTAAAAPRQVALTLNAGESFVIKGLKPDATPAVHVVDNPDALIVHSDNPGELVLLGSSTGQWKIDVVTSAGESVIYNVKVNAIAEPFTNPLKPGKNPSPIGDPAASAGSAKPSASTALDAGSGPAPEPASAPPAVAPPAVTVASAGSAGATRLPPVPSAAPSVDPPAPGAAPSVDPPAAAPGRFTGAAPAATPLAPVSAAPTPNYSRDSMDSGTLMPSQSISTTPSQAPLQNFKANPLVIPHSDAVTGGTHFLPADVVDLAAGNSKIFDFPRRIRRISIADTNVADIQVINPYQINLIGHKEGFTTLAIWDNQGVYEERQVRVDPHGKQQVMLNVIVAELDRSRLEGAGINWTAALPNYNVSLVGLGGQVATQYTPSTSLMASEVFGAGSPSAVTVQSTAVGTLPAQGTLIPLLLSTNMNYGLAAGNSNVQTQTFFEAMEQHNLAKILAEPHILANSGEKAEFLSGGEIPIVISQALNTSIVFKQFGTSVIFVPTVIGSDDIGLEVKPEVSQPDYAHGVSLFGFTVPAFVTRKAQTYVRLKNNQTLIIAGLLLRTKTSSVQKTPYLGDIPYLGLLFKSTSYQENLTDLVMSVTPQLIGPLPDNAQVALPTNRGPMSPEEIRTRRLIQTDASRPRF